MRKYPAKYHRWLFTMFLLGVLLSVPLLALSKSRLDYQNSADLKTIISQIADRSIPAVVHIEVTQRQEIVNPFLPFENDPFFHYFFNGPRMPHKFQQELKGLGTGVIMDPEGHILTNNHVVGGATEIHVLLANGESYSAELVGADPKTDLAVLKIDGKKSFAYLEFGDSDNVKVGEWVVAIGHPRGLDHTVTQGIISAKHRQGITDPSSYQDFLQTDAAINPGNSGGPLLNLLGEVIGINAAIATQSGGYEGIGFAIPSKMAVHTAQQLIEHGKVDRGWLGISIQDLTPDLAKSLHVGTTKGALIADVVKGGPAEQAGMKRGDVIVDFGGKAISNTSALRNETANTPIGEKVQVTVIRKRDRKTFTVKIGSLENATKTMAQSLRERLGATFRSLDAKETKKYSLGPNQGVAIIWLDSRGPLAQLGFELGDVVLEVNGRTVDGLQGFIDLVAALRPNQRVTFLALDHHTGQTGYVQVKIG